MQDIIKIGIGVMLLDDDKILLGHRATNKKDTGGIYETDCWTLPGGKQEYDETIYEAAIRETKEETNLDISELSVFTASDSFQPDRHYVTIDFVTNTYAGELKVTEPDKIDKWEWFELNNLPKNIYSPSKYMIDEYINKNK